MSTDLGVMGVPQTFLNDDYICVGGVWKHIEAIYMCVGGVWKAVSERDVCVSSAWKM